MATANIDAPSILARLQGVRQTSSGQWEAKCPTHDDREASLCIGLGDDGRILLHCQAGCATADVVARLGMKMSDLMGSNGQPANNRPWIVATYDYRDEGGELLFQVCRFEPKDFRQRRPDGKGGWAWNVKGVRKVPYGLPQLTRADPQQYVFAPEGERDVDKLGNLGLVATCNAGGAGKWRPELSDFLRDRRVVILPDNDEPGRKHAEKVARSLAGKAASVKVLELPGLPEKGDVSDWLDNGNTAEKLLELAEAAEEWKAGKASKPSAGMPESAISNVNYERAEDKDGNEVAIAVPKPMEEVIAGILQRMSKWPRQVDGALFVHDKVHGICWLDQTSAVFGWLARKCGPIDWHRKHGCVTKEEAFAELQRTVQRYEAIEEFPHIPRLQNHYYTCPTPEPGDGKAVSKLLDFFSLETPIDRQLLLAAFATGLWGGPPGTRPAMLVTATRGRGKGKSKVAQLIGEFWGGAIDVSAKGDIDTVKTRFLSAEAASKRVALLDNVKSLRFSWGELEALITANVISGRRLYQGEGRRPNYLCWAITLNGANLSTDMSQRVVEIRTTDVQYRDGWEEEVSGFIRENRDAVIGDLVAFFGQPKKKLRRYSRWATWEGGVLSRVEDPDGCLDVILERRGQVDVEQEESGILEDYIAGQLRRLDYDPDRSDVHLPNPVIARWYNAAMGDRAKVPAISRMLRQAINEGRIHHLRANEHHGYGRGFRWLGEHADIGEPTSYDIGRRMAKKRQQAGDSTHEEEDW